MINETINATVTPTFVESLTQTYIPTTLDRLIEVISVPIQVPEMLWIISPMVISMLILAFYFGRYRGEELGWNSAVSNSLILVFVAIDLLRFWFGHNDLSNILLSGSLPYGLLGPIIVFFLGFWLLFFEFFHLLPKQLAFFVGSSIPINVIAYTAIANVYAQLPFDLFTVLAMIVLFLVLNTVLITIKHMIPQAHLGGKQKEL